MDRRKTEIFQKKTIVKWLGDKRKTVPTLPGVSSKNIKNVTKKVLTDLWQNAIIYKSPKYGRQAEP